MNTTKNNNDKKEKMTEGLFVLKKLRARTWPVSYLVAMSALMFGNANTNQHGWVFLVVGGVTLGLVVAMCLDIRMSYAAHVKGEEMIDDMRDIFDKVRGMGERAKWVSDHAEAKVEWNYDEQRAEVSVKTDDGDLQCMIFVEAKDNDTNFEDDIIGARAMDKLDVIVYQVPNDIKTRRSRTRWLRLGSGSTMMQGLNQSFERINAAMRDVYDLKTDDAPET